MSTAVSIFNNAQIQEADLSYMTSRVDPLTQRLAGGNIGKRLSIKGGVFRMMSGSNEIAATPDRHLNVVVIDAAPAIARTYYEGKYQEGMAITPVCTSEDGVKPDTTCAKKQSSTCAVCTQNIKGSGEGESKACRYSQRFAIVLATDIEGDVYALNLAASSLFGKGPNNAMPLQQYARMLAGHGLGVNSVVTRMSFDLSKPVPVLVFSAERPLNKDEYHQVLKQKDSDDCLTALAPPTYTGMATPTPVPTLMLNEPIEVEEDAPVPTPVPTPPEEPVVKASGKSQPAPPEVKPDILALLDEWAD